MPCRGWYLSGAALGFLSYVFLSLGVVPCAAGAVYTAPQDLGTLGGGGAYATGINNSGASCQLSSRQAPSGWKHAWSFKERPLPERRWFFLTHTGVAARIDAGSALYPRSAAYALLDYGALRNISERWGIGGNLYLGADDRRVRFGVKGRMRRWVTRDVALDLAPVFWSLAATIGKGPQAFRDLSGKEPSP